MADFFDNYAKWRDDCLKQFNEKYGNTFGKRSIHTLNSDDDYIPDKFVDFAEDGSAYLHSLIGGTNYIPNAVTPWTESPYFME